MAMPMSARESTGASLMPSPTKASFPLGEVSCSSASTRSTLSPGSSWVYASSRPSSWATASPTSLASPVSRTVFFTSWAFRAAMASLACGLTMSEMTMCPAYRPSMAMWMMVPTLWQLMYGMPRRSISLPLPAATERPSTTAVTPSPLISRMSETRPLSISRP